MVKRTMLLTLLTGGLAAWAAAGGPTPGRAAPPPRDAVQLPSPSAGFEGLLRPSKRVPLAFSVSGIIAQRPVAEGDRVKAGQLIAELNSDMKKVARDRARLKAESEHQIQAARMDEEQSKVELGRVEDLCNQKAATEWEYKKVKVEADIAHVRTEYAEYNHKLDAKDLEAAEIDLKDRRLIAPFDGIVWKMVKEAGEAAQELNPIAELVNLDPLWVELNLPADQFGQVQRDQMALVTLAGKSREGKVILVDPLVDFGSKTFRVRVELPNADSAFTAGLKAEVKFLPAKAAPAPQVSAAAPAAVATAPDNAAAEK